MPSHKPTPKSLRSAANSSRAPPIYSRALDGWREAFRIVQAKEVWDSFGDFITRAKPKLGPGIKERMAFAATVTADQADAAGAIVAAARAHIRALVPSGTIMALPTAPSIAPLADAGDIELESFRCPAGLSLIGWAGGDEALLDLAVALARACGIAHL